MSSPIKVTYTRSNDDRPLVQIDGGVFCDVIRTPADLRAMASMLLKVADEAEARPTTGRNWMPGRVLLNADGTPAVDAVGFRLDAKVIGGGCVPAARRPAPASSPAGCALQPGELGRSPGARAGLCATTPTTEVRQ